jgi:hypothetical protein
VSAVTESLSMLRRRPAKLRLSLGAHSRWGQPTAIKACSRRRVPGATTWLRGARLPWSILMCRTRRAVSGRTRRSLGCRCGRGRAARGHGGWSARGHGDLVDAAAGGVWLAGGVARRGGGYAWPPSADGLCAVDGTAGRGVEQAAPVSPPAPAQRLGGPMSPRTLGWPSSVTPRGSSVG